MILPALQGQHEIVTVSRPVRAEQGRSTEDGDLEGITWCRRGWRRLYIASQQMKAKYTRLESRRGRSPVERATSVY